MISNVTTALVKAMIKDVTETMIVPMESMKLIVEYVLELNSNVKRRVLVSST